MSRDGSQTRVPQEPGATRYASVHVRKTHGGGGESGDDESEEAKEHPCKSAPRGTPATAARSACEIDLHTPQSWSRQARSSTSAGHGLALELVGHAVTCLALLVTPVGALPHLCEHGLQSDQPLTAHSTTGAGEADVEKEEATYAPSVLVLLSTIVRFSRPARVAAAAARSASHVALLLSRMLLVPVAVL